MNQGSPHEESSASYRPRTPLPEPGGWTRIQLEVDDLAREVEALRSAGVQFGGDIITGFGGKRILLGDPAGNPIELLEPRGT